jgi:Rho-binding antiterminator
MSGDKKYEPMNCEIHDGYELACIRKAIHEVTWLEEGQTVSAKLRFLDIECTQGAEYLIAEKLNTEPLISEKAQHKTLKIRLDMITSTLPY